MEGRPSGVSGLDEIYVLRLLRLRDGELFVLYDRGSPRRWKRLHFASDRTWFLGALDGFLLGGSGNPVLCIETLGSGAGAPLSERACSSAALEVLRSMWTAR